MQYESVARVCYKRVIPFGPAIIFNRKRAMDRQAYINHLLNISASKQTHQFPKAQRFPKSKKVATEAIYALPGTSSKRATTFGFGCKLNLANKTTSPPPGSYNLPSDFEKRQLMSTTTFHQGRAKITFGSFLLETLKRKKNMPSPDRYSPKQTYCTIGGKMGFRLQTEPNEKGKIGPGPGAYQLTSIQLANKGHYVLSTIKNSTSPRYSTDHRPQKPKARPLQPFTYDIQQKKPGTYSISKYQNSPQCSFPRAARASLADRSKSSFPGAKYRSFSQFGN